MMDIGHFGACRTSRAGMGERISKTGGKGERNDVAVPARKGFAKVGTLVLVCFAESLALAVTRARFFDSASVGWLGRYKV